MDFTYLVSDLYTQVLAAVLAAWAAAVRADTEMVGGVEWGYTVEDGVATVTRTADDAQSRASHGTTRALLANMAKGVTEGYSRELEIQGVGYRASLAGNVLTLNVGFSHPIDYEIPEGIKLTVKDATELKVEGIDKQLVGQVSARIRAFCPPEPYKGKGIRYKDEHVRRKAGKTVA